MTAVSIIKSYSVGNGDMFYIDYNSDNFTIIDCCLNDDTQQAIFHEILSLEGSQRRYAIHIKSSR